MLQQHCCYCGTPVANISQKQWLQAHLGIPLDARHLAKGKACFSQSLIVRRRNSDDANVVGWLTISARHQTSETSLLPATAGGHPGYLSTAVCQQPLRCLTVSFAPSSSSRERTCFWFWSSKEFQVNPKAYVHECNRFFLPAPQRCRLPAIAKLKSIQGRTACA